MLLEKELCVDKERIHSGAHAHTHTHNAHIESHKHKEIAHITIIGCVT